MSEASTADRAADEHEIVITRVVEAPRLLVWKAWTDPAHIVRWWGPSGCRSADCAVDLRIGGAFSLLMHGPDGAIYPCAGVFREIVPPARLVYEGDPGACTACGAGLPPGARVTVTFDEEGAKTRVTIVTRFTSAAAHRAAEEAGLAIGWPQSLDRLSALVLHLSLQNQETT